MRLNCVLLVCRAHVVVYTVLVFFFFQAEDGIRDLVRSRGLGDVYKRQPGDDDHRREGKRQFRQTRADGGHHAQRDPTGRLGTCLLYTSDAADERSSVDLGGRRIIKKNNT